ncbi:MAG: hypothetical protein RL497_2286 [Pseudomonadota bacterium]|jgi:hypothetical protein
MRIAEVKVKPNWMLSILTDDGCLGEFDVSPYLQYEAFEALKDPVAFSNIFNGVYFIEWGCGADLSADTIESQLKVRSYTVGDECANPSIPFIR